MEYIANENYLIDVANSIRYVTNTTDNVNFKELPAIINNLGGNDSDLVNAFLVRYPDYNVLDIDTNFIKQYITNDLSFGVQRGVLGYPVNEIKIRNAMDLSYAYNNTSIEGEIFCGINTINMSLTYSNCCKLSSQPVCSNNVINMYYTYYNCRKACVW